MFSPTGGAVVEVYGLACHLPPVPEPEQIQGHHLPVKDQKWYRLPLPDIKVSDIEIYSNENYNPRDVISWEAARREEHIKQTGFDPWQLDKRGNMKQLSGIDVVPHFVFPQLEEFRKQELALCHPDTGGSWIMIHGKPYYITPFHRFYLQWWKLNTGYPDWRWVDAQRYYHWQYCYEDPRCYGRVEASKRGDGKTYRATGIGYQMTIYRKNAHTGIQSKTDDDAEELFQLKLVEPYKDLPDFFVPINSNPSDPKSSLRFFFSSSLGKNASINREKQKEAIRSQITFRNAKANAYDGSTLRFLLRDEEGKCGVQIDVNERHNITKSCVYRDGRIVGKIYSTTTVEKWEKGGAKFKPIWDASHPSTRTILGETPSGLYRIFFPAFETEFFDEYGFSDVEKAKREQSIKRKSYEDDPEAYVQYVLQFPWNEDEMFQMAGLTCQYNLAVLRERERYVNSEEFRNSATLRVGNFRPVAGIGSEIKWEDDELNGHWNVVRFLKPGEKCNVITKINGSDLLYKPNNNARFTAGFDPTKTNANPDKRRSFAGGSILEKFDINNPLATPNFVADYVWKPDKPENAILEFLYGCWYYGCEFLIESNIGISPILEMYGCQLFIAMRPLHTFAPNSKIREEEGLPASTTINDYLLKAKQDWMHDNAEKLILPRIIRDSIGYDPANRTQFDLEVATQNTIINVTARPVRKEVLYDLGNLIRQTKKKIIYN